MKTSEEIKKALSCCAKSVCASCPYKDCDTYDECSGALAADALVHIQQIERERDALRYDMQLLALTNMCEICKYNKHDEDECQRTADKCFAWRGLCKENGGAEDGN